VTPRGTLWQTERMERSPVRRGKEEAAERILYRGKTLDRNDLRTIRRIVSGAKGENLRQLSERVCKAFEWYRPNGELRERSAKALLRRLEKRGLVQLPPGSARRTPSNQGPANGAGRRRALPPEDGPKVSNDTDRERGLVVRPIVAQERRAWRQHMACYHYLGCGRLVGESICYAALLGGQVVGLVAWAAAALKCGVRDRYVGWDEATKAAKLGFVVNNVRFLILPNQQKNLASRILGANLRRLSADWKRAYGHAVHLAETFVDARRFRGTCYRASNWQLLGETRGWARSGATYQHHGAKKLVFVYPLSGHGLAFLRAPELVEKEVRRVSMIDVEKLPLKGEGGLIEELEALPDFRKPRGKRFSLSCILSIAACAVLSGMKSFIAMAQWAREIPEDQLKRLGCRRKFPPAEKTFRLVLGRMGAEAFEERVGQWSARTADLPGEGIALDGKTVRGSADGETPPTHLLSAFTHTEGVVLQESRVTPDKTNEIPCVNPLLEDLEIEDSVVTADAMHTQKETARYIVEDKKADYLFTVKGNQPGLCADIDLLHLEAFPPSGHHGEQGARPDRNTPALGE